MFEELEAAIEGLVIPGDGESIVAAIALRDRLDAHIAEATAAFEAGGLWGGGAAVSLVAWLRAHARMTRRGAQRLRSVSARLRSLPVCSQAYAEGMLSGGQVEAIVARLDDETVEIFAAQESELVPYLTPLTVAGVSRAVGAWLALNCPERAEPEAPERALYLSPTDRWVLDGLPRPRGRSGGGRRPAPGHPGSLRRAEDGGQSVGRRPGRRLPVLPGPPAGPGRGP